jgi:hypothetical protein
MPDTILLEGDNACRFVMTQVVVLRRVLHTERSFRGI